jgi:hypothetical protein
VLVLPVSTHALGRDNRLAPITNADGRRVTCCDRNVPNVRLNVAQSELAYPIQS